MVHKKSPVVQMDDYYPFGLTFNSYQRENSVANQYKYNGKEEQDELDLGWFDYGARMYQPDIGRWNGIDALADDFVPLSPYAYVANNPVVQIDPDGMEVVFGNAESEKQFNRIYSSADDKTRSKLDQLRASDVKYNVNISSDLKLDGGQSSYDFKNDQVNMNINPTNHEGDVIAMLGDELTHASQYENGEIGYIQVGETVGSVGYDMQDEVDSKLGAMKAVESVNKAEGGDLELTGTTKRFAEQYNNAPSDKKDQAAEEFFKNDKVGKKYMGDFNEKEMGKQSDIQKDISSYDNVVDYRYRENGKTKRKGT